METWQIRISLHLDWPRKRVLKEAHSLAFTHRLGLGLALLLKEGLMIWKGVLAKRRCYVATPLWPSVGVKPNTPKVGDLESSGTPECLEFDNKDQKTLHWGVLGVIGKVLKRRYRKWPRIGHLDICNPSYGQKKGRESNWQFDSRPLKVGNRPAPNVRWGSAMCR